MNSTDFASSRTYGEAICDGFHYLLENYPDVFVIGQGLWSPWYVGNSMTDLDKKFGSSRVIDTPVSEAACTGAAVGASIAGMRPIVVHPRMDFMMYAIDPIVNQAAKWSHMFGGQAKAPVTIRAIINRGGEQGAQHSQALHSWFAHIPGLRVVMPSNALDARDLLVSSVLCDDPVVYIDDRWLYDQVEELPPIKEVSLSSVGPKICTLGEDVTIVASGFSTKIALDSFHIFRANGISPEIIDLRIINPFDPTLIVKSVQKTGRLLVVDSGTKACGFSAEVISATLEKLDIATLKSSPVRVSLPDAPAPTASSLEKLYYPTSESLFQASLKLFK